jgi:hypothetical protein
MPFSVGDVVQVSTPDPSSRGRLGRIEKILPNRFSQQDFQEYVVEFPDVPSGRFRFCLFREFELRAAVCVNA